MQSRERVYLSGLSYELGEEVVIDSIALPGISAEDITLLWTKGLHSFSRFQGSITESIRDCSRESLERAGVSPEDVDCILVVTESFLNLQERTPASGETPIRAVRNFIFDTLTSIGIRKTQFLCSSFGGSSNLLSALALAIPALWMHSIKNMLLVCIDVHPPDYSRFMDDALAVIGDGIATCLLTREPRGRVSHFSVDHFSLVPHFDAINHANMSKMMLDLYRASKGAAADCYEALCLQPCDYRQLISSNYNLVTSEIFGKLLGFDSQRVFVENLRRTGHVPSCDIVINLYDAVTSSRIAVGDRVLAYINGPISCGAISLTCQH